LQPAAFKGLSIDISFGTVSTDDLADQSSKLIVYSQNTGNLFYNADGTEAGLGDGGIFAQLTGSPAIAATDFTLG
jgi:Ca2+-binding RTX toxin-like protein